MHNDIKESGLGTMLGISSVVDSDDPRAQYLGKRVRYINPDPVKLGHMALERDFIVRELQNDYKGDPKLRGYAIDRETGEQIENFGRPISMDEVEIIETKQDGE